jgi:hypothetical protein
VLALRELLALLGDAGACAGDPEAAAVEAGLEGRIPKKDAWKPFWARGVDMVGYSINGLRTSTLPFVETGTARSTQMVRLAFGRDDTARLLDVSLPSHSCFSSQGLLVLCTLVLHLSLRVTDSLLYTLSCRRARRTG